MGLFDFVKEAGERIFGASDAEAAEAAAKVEAARKAQEEADAAVAQGLKGMVSSLGLGVSNLGVAFSGGLATITGIAASQEDREKVVLVVGNTQGVAQVDDKMTLEVDLGPVQGPELPPPAVMHTVVSGDTLSKIAKAHYGDANKYHAIFEANKPMLSHPDKIYPGQVLRIPQA